MVGDLLKHEFKILGVVTPSVEAPVYEGTISSNIPSKIEETKKMCLLDQASENDLSTKNMSKLQLAKQINNNVIILTDFSKGLNQKELKSFKNLFYKLTTKYRKRIILVSRDVNFLAMMCESIAICDNKVIYYAKDIYDDKLYTYIDMPKIIKFIKYSNSKDAGLKYTVDINELIKDVYRRKHENKTDV